MCVEVFVTAQFREEKEGCTLLFKYRVCLKNDNLSTCKSQWAFSATEIPLKNKDSRNKETRGEKKVVPLRPYILKSA